MKKLKLTGYVIRLKSFSETDELVTLYTSELGKVRAVAKGIKHMKSKMRFLLHPASHVVIELVGKSLLKTISLVDKSPAGLGNPLMLDMDSVTHAEKLNLWFAASELLIRSTPDEQVAPGLYDALSHFVRELNDDNLEAALVRFKRAVLRELGGHREELTFASISEENKVITSDIETILERRLLAQDPVI